jgi:hypothetical protein
MFAKPSIGWSVIARDSIENLFLFFLLFGCLSIVNGDRPGINSPRFGLRMHNPALNILN